MPAHGTAEARIRGMPMLPVVQGDALGLWADVLSTSSAHFSMVTLVAE